MAKRYQYENQTRDVIVIPVEAGGNADNGKLFVLGDSADTDSKVPPGRERDERLQPNPVRVVSDTEYKSFGAFAQTILDDQVAQKRIRRLELAA